MLGTQVWKKTTSERISKKQEQSRVQQYPFYYKVNEEKKPNNLPF